MQKKAIQNVTEMGKERKSTGVTITIGSPSEQSLNNSLLCVKNDQEEKEMVPIPPDGGWGWVVVFASFMCNVVLDGIAYTFGVLLTPLVLHFNSDRSTVSWVGSLLCGMYMLSGPIVGGLVNRFGCRPVCMFGAVFAWISISLSTLSVNVPMLMITYGIMGGFGLGLIYLPAIVSVGYYFETKRALATGISVCGSGVGTFIFAPLANVLLETDTFTWKTSNLIFGGICLSCLLFGALMRPLEVEDSTGRMFEAKGETIGVELPDGTKAVSSHEDYQPSGGHMPSIRSVDTMPEIKEEDSDQELCNDGNEIHFTENEKLVKQFEKRMRKRNLSDNLHIPNHNNNIHRNYSTPHLRPVTTRKNSLLSTLDSGASLHISHSSSRLALPMSRQDIFYTGSMNSLDQNTETAGMKSNNQSYVSIRDRGSLTYIPRHSLVDTRIEKEINKDGSGNLFMSVLKSMIDLSLLKDTKFLLICISNIFGFLGFYVPFVYLPSMVAENDNISTEQAAFLLSVIGISNTLGRIISGWLSDFPWIDSLFVTNCSLLLSSIFVILFPFITTYEMLVVCCTMFGLAIASYISLTSIVLVDIMGIENLTTSFGLLTMFRGAASIIGPPLAGAVFETTQNMHISFFLAGGFLAAAGLTSFIADCIRRREKIIAL